MSSLGVHYALTEAEANSLRAKKPGRARIEYFQQEIATRYFKQFPEWKAESAQAWDAMHRALTDGRLKPNGGIYPLNHVVLGGENLESPRSTYILVLKTPKQVGDVYAALHLITREDFRQGYFKIATSNRGFLGISLWGYDHPLSEEDFEFTWEGFLEVQMLFQRAAYDGRYILFAASQ